MAYLVRRDIDANINTLVSKFGPLARAQDLNSLRLLAFFVKKWRPSWILATKMDFDRDKNYRNESFSMNSI